MREWLESILFNLSQKTKNPFFGTLFAVFFFRHWQFFYALLNFDVTTTLKEKQYFIYNHFSDKAWLEEIYSTVFLAMLALIVSYIFLNLSRLIVNWFERKVTPWVYKVTDNTSIVLKIDFDRLKLDNDRLQKRYEEERQEKIRYREENERLVSANLETSKNSLVVKNEITSDKNVVPFAHILNSETSIPTKSQLIFEKLKNENKFPALKEIVEEVVTGNKLIKDNEFVKYFASMDIIKVKDRLDGSYNRYELTDIGREIYDLFLFKKDGP
jgi:hypothetical protein